MSDDCGDCGNCDCGDCGNCDCGDCGNCDCGDCGKCDCGDCGKCENCCDGCGNDICCIVVNDDLGGASGAPYERSLDRAEVASSTSALQRRNSSCCATLFNSKRPMLTFFNSVPVFLGVIAFLVHVVMDAIYSKKHGESDPNGHFRLMMIGAAEAALLLFQLASCALTLCLEGRSRSRRDASMTPAREHVAPFLDSMERGEEGTGGSTVPMGLSVGQAAAPMGLRVEQPDLAVVGVLVEQPGHDVQKPTF